MNGRAYDPIVGRFLSADNRINSPGETQSFNLYSYCLNNPLKYTDPSGHNEIEGGEKGGVTVTAPEQMPYNFGDQTMRSIFSGHYNYNSAASSRFNDFAWRSAQEAAKRYAQQQFNSQFKALPAQIAGLTVDATNVVIPDRLPEIMYSSEPQTFFEQGGSSSGGGNNSLGVGTAFSTAGIAGDAASISNSTFRLTNGAYNGSQFSPRNYPTGWTGFGRAQITTYSVSRLGGYLSTSANVAGTGIAAYQLYKGTQTTMTLPDFLVGTAGVLLSARKYFYGKEIPVVGEAIMLYGIGRTTWDTFFWLGQKYGPSTWYGYDNSKWFK